MNNKEEIIIALAEAREAVRQMSWRVGLLHICFARALIDDLGEEQGTDLIEKAIWDYGTKIGRHARERIEAMGL
jgi:hypothetical protein